MKMFIPLMYLASLVLAEPPVGDGYPSSRSSHDDQHHEHHATDHQRSLSQEYGLPSDSVASVRNSPSNGYDYNSPNARSSLNARGQSQFPPATVRVSFNQRFGSANTRSSGQDHFSPDSRSLSQEYATPNARSGISQEYGPPNARSLSQEYGTPSIVAARSLSTEYGVPNTRSSPSEEYGTPVIAARSSKKSQDPSSFRTAQQAKGLSQDHSSPAARSQNQGSHSQGFEAPRPFAKSSFASRSVSPSSTYGAPSSRSLSISYDAPSSRSAGSYSDDYSQKELSETYGTPSGRSLSQEYGAPSSRSNLNTNAFASSYAARSSPSSSYLPASRSVAPSEQYGVPEQRDGGSQGYDYARAKALDELLSQEPANYDFAYQIEDYESGSDFGHAETRQADRAEGSYFVVLPDGTKQTVEYEADEGGFKPRISVEPADASARSGGYDENAADIAGARSADGPY